MKTLQSGTGLPVWDFPAAVPRRIVPNWQGSPEAEEHPHPMGVPSRRASKCAGVLPAPEGACFQRLGAKDGAAVPLRTCEDRSGLGTCVCRKPVRMQN